MISFCSANAKGCGENHDPCGKNTEWNEYETVALHVNQEGMPGPNNYYMQSSRKNGDLQVDIDIPDSHAPQHGTILMVEGRTFLSKGLKLTQGSEIDALDGPVLSVILTGKVLSRALPEGPAALTRKQQVMHEDKKTGIQFATPSAQGFIPFPWSVKGFITPNTDGSIDFNLVLKWASKGATNAKEATSVSLSGQLIHNANFQIDSSMPLEGWSVFGVGPIVEKAKDSTIYDYGAKPTETSAKTIADIRKEIAIESSPGEPDLSLKLAGFWKGKCSDTYGLRVKPVDKAGMYTVTFCGPGGCGDEQNERETYITGDKQYHVVNANELQVGPSDNRSTYIKCSEKMLP